MTPGRAASATGAATGSPEMVDQLELNSTPESPPVSDRGLLQDAAEAASFLSLGDDSGVGASTLLSLRRQLIDSVRELARRWGL